LPSTEKLMMSLNRQRRAIELVAPEQKQILSLSGLKREPGGAEPGDRPVKKYKRWLLIIGSVVLFCLVLLGLYLALAGRLY
jgi:hypothetical protein